MLEISEQYPYFLANVGEYKLKAHNGKTIRFIGKKIYTWHEVLIGVCEEENGREYIYDYMYYCLSQRSGNYDCRQAYLDCIYHRPTKTYERQIKH